MNIVRCGKCEGEFSTSILNGDNSPWFDPYSGKEAGEYVHLKCLSEKRKLEIVTKAKQERPK